MLAVMTALLMIAGCAAGSDARPGPLDLIGGVLLGTGKCIYDSLADDLERERHWKESGRP